MTLNELYGLLFGKSNIKDGDVIDMAEHGRSGGISTGQGFKFTREIDELTLIDEASAIVTYIGKAKSGTATSAAAWLIKKISKSGNVTTIAFVNGSTESYNQIWDNRASLSYS